MRLISSRRLPVNHLPLRSAGCDAATPLAVAGALNDDLVAGVGQAVQGAIAQDGIIEEAEPLVHSPVAGDDEAGRPMRIASTKTLPKANSFLNRSAIVPVVTSEDTRWLWYVDNHSVGANP